MSLKGSDCPDSNIRYRFLSAFTMLSVSTEDIVTQLLSGDSQNLANFFSAIGLRVKDLLHQIQHLVQTQAQLCLQVSKFLQVIPVQSSNISQYLWTSFILDLVL